MSMRSVRIGKILYEADRHLGSPTEAEVGCKILTQGHLALHKGPIEIDS
jgi:hypothetical protein